MSDRPVVRQLIRLAARLTGRPHRQDIWPGLAVDRASGLVTWRGNPLLTLLSFAEIVPPDMPLIAIVGSGPSVADQDPTRLPPRSAILLNGAASLAGSVPPLAVMVEDERFVFRHMAMLARLSPDIPLLLSPAALRAMAERDSAVLKDRRVALIDNLAKPVNQARRTLADPALDAVLTRGVNGTALSRDPDTGVVIFGTVALSAVQVALAATPNRILLVGIDLTNAANTPRFYEVKGAAAASGIVAGLDRILGGFALARDLAGANDIMMTCASPVSALLDIEIAYDPQLSTPSQD
ncbi:glycosyl transferase [Loktanella sp. R86503]|uniref:glycosyl transferase n=1 Tax=Loktanella sp. R86503 TaxID=3093847 RepID=UPI0036DF7FC8